MKLRFPISTFNENAYFFAISKNIWHENMQITLRTTKNVFNTKEN